MQPMTYSQFAESLHEFFINRLKGENLVFSIILLAAVVLFLIFFVIYLRRAYIERKATVDTFDSSNNEKIDYPGFHQGKLRDVVKKDEKADKWGKIEDD